MNKMPINVNDEDNKDDLMESKKMNDKNKIDDKLILSKPREEILFNKIVSQNTQSSKKDKASSNLISGSKIHNSNALGMAGKMQYENKYQ